MNPLRKQNGCLDSELLSIAIELSLATNNCPNHSNQSNEPTRRNVCVHQQQSEGLYALRNIQGENVQLRTNSGVLQSNNPRNPIVNNVGHYQHYSRPLCMQQSSATSCQRVSINVRCGPTSNEFNNQLITNETSTLSNAINQQQRTSIVSSGHSQPSKASSSMQTLTARVSHKNKSGNVSKPQRPSTSGVDLSMSNACVICFGAQKIYACIPCGHRCICNSCFKNSRYMITKCPLCRKTITQILKIYD